MPQACLRLLLGLRVMLCGCCATVVWRFMPALCKLQQDLTARVRHGRAVNLDPASLILDMIFKIEQTARTVAAK